MSPGAGTSIDSTTTIQADIEYSITNFESSREYYLAPLFDSNEGSGRTFNEFQRITDGWRLREPKGVVTLRYPIARELKSKQLARPVRVTFYVMVRSGAHTTEVIGRSDPTEFGPAV